MIYFWCRVGVILATKGIKPKWDLNEEISLNFRVRLFDCDGLKVMCGFKYPMYMDIGRWANASSAGFVTLAIKNKWAPVLRTQKVFYLRPLRLWSLFKVKVSLAGFDDKWFYHKHIFKQNDSIKAVGITKCGIWKKRKIVPIKDVISDPRVICKDIPLPVWIKEIFPDEHEQINFHN
jgi:acyl-CoA thioesterase FadM